MKLWSAVSTAVFSIALIAAMLPTAASAAGTVPTAPTGVSAVAGNATVTASWSGSVGDGGSAITGYTATASPGGATCTDGTAPFTCTMAGLNGVSYTVTVKAENVNGSSAASAPSSPVTPGTFPSIPGTPTVSGTGTANEVLVSWAASASLGGGTFTGYTATSIPAGGTCTTTGATSCTVTGLPAVGHTFTVHATNSLGSSGESGASASITATGLPGAPGAVSATAGDGQLTLVWTAPTVTGGSSLIGYDLVADNGGASVTAGPSDTSAVLTGLVNGKTYVVTITAKNSSGSGTADTFTGTAPVGAPDVATGVTAAPNGTTKQIVVTWVVPASLGGRTFVKYDATADSGETCGTAPTSRTATSCIVTVAANAVNHTFSVHVVTSGPVNGPESASSSPAAAGLLPATLGTSGFTAAPTGVSGEVLVSWVPATPAPGVLPVLGYKVTAATSTNTCTATTASSCTVAGQTDGTSDNFTVLSRNAAGWALASPTAVPGTSSTAPTAAPTAVAATAVTATSATIGWTILTDTVLGGNGGSAITDYVVTSSPASTFSTTAGATKATINVTGLSAGTAYTFSIHAQNARGSGPESSSITVTPTATPGAPTLALSLPITGNVKITASAPAVIGGTGITTPTYALTISPVATSPATALTVNVATNVTTGASLVDGTSYTYSVVTTNNGVSGPAATVTQVAGALLAPPTAGGLVGAMLIPLTGGTSVRVQNWNTVTNATGYTVKAFSDAGRTVAAGTNCSSSSTFLECTVTGLSPSTQYFFSIFTNNAVGSSATPLVLDNAGTPASLQTTTLDTTPGAPTGVTATSGTNGSSAVSWTAPAYGGSGITSYSVTATEVGASTSLAAQTLASGAPYLGLTNGKSYTFTVKAVATSGTSAASAASAAATPATFPGAPVNLTGVVGDGQVVLSWDAPVGTGGVGIDIDAYGVGINSPGGLTAQCTTTGATSCTVTGLANGTAYTFEVAAHNATATGNGGGGPITAGWSANSATSAPLTPASVSGAPSGATATAGNGQATVAWTAPSSDGDSTLILYTATASPGGATCLQSAFATASCSVTGLSNGTFYTFSVTATNGVGESAASGSTASVQPRVGAALDTTVNHAFTDVGTVGTEAANAIAALFNTTPAITQGLNATTYGPLNPVNRANMAVFLSRSIQAVGHAVNTTVNHTFADVAGLTAEQQSSIAAIGNTTPAITNGATATSYAPSSTVSRQEMAAFLSRTWQSLGGTCDSTVNHTFGDVGTSFAQADIACVNNLGIANGTTATTFEPAAPVNRLQMALFLFRLVDAAVAQGL